MIFFRQIKIRKTRSNLPTDKKTPTSTKPVGVFYQKNIYLSLLSMAFFADSGNKLNNSSIRFFSVIILEVFIFK